jgi:CRISPR-associated exonuclease Cas4
MTLPLAVLLILLSIALFWLATRQQKIAGLPSGRVIYSDTSRWAAVEKPLFDAVLGLAGKPDYLVETGESEEAPIIPVEVKSRHSGQAPYDSHIFQLAAYCLLVERQLGKRPPYGILKYPDQVFSIDFTPALETALRSTLESMRSAERRKEVARSHDSPPRCARCGYRGVCDQNLLH